MEPMCAQGEPRLVRKQTRCWGRCWGSGEAKGRDNQHNGPRRHKGSSTNPDGLGEEGQGESFRGVDSGSCVETGQGKKQRQQEHEEQRHGNKALCRWSSG